MSRTNFAKAIDNVSTLVAAPYVAKSGSLTVGSTEGIVLFGSQFVRVSIFRAGFSLTILKATAVLGNVLTIEGAIDGYLEVDLIVGDVAELRVTAGAFTDIQNAINLLEDLETTTVYTTSFYADPAWITSLAGSKVVGPITGNATSITGTITESQVSNLTTDLANKATDTLVVHLAGTETITGPKTFTSTINATGNLVTTSGTELVLAQTGDTFGATKIHVRNRPGSAGALFENVGLDLIDFGFVTNAGIQQNIRFEHRVAVMADPANSTGEFQFIFSPSINFRANLVIGDASVIVAGKPSGFTTSTANFAISGVPFSPTTKCSIYSTDTNTYPLAIRLFTNQAVPAIIVQNSNLATIFSVNSDGSVSLPTLTDAASKNNSLYYSSTTSRLTYRDPSGVLHRSQN